MKSIISKLAYLDTWNQYSVIKNKIKYYICAFIIKTKKENRNKIRKKKLIKLNLTENLSIKCIPLKLYYGELKRTASITENI